jgi:hypothetical protein
MHTEEEKAPTKFAPERNPDVGKPAGRQKKAKSSKIRAGNTLVPELTNPGLGVTKSFWYWVGVTPSTPVEHIDLAGICFPKVNELIVPDPMRTNQKKRIPVIGSLVKLSQQDLLRLEERLRRTVIRFYDDKGVREEVGTGQNVGDNHIRPRRGKLITIQTAEEQQLRAQMNKPVRTYTPSPNDAPAARFVFAQLCEDQEKGTRGSFYPEVLEDAGLEWPAELEV